MSINSYDLDRIGNPIGRLALAQERLAKAEERKADAYARIANALERHWRVDKAD